MLAVQQLPLPWMPLRCLNHKRCFGIALLLLFLCLRGEAAGAPAWKVAVSDAVAQVYNAQDFYEALALVEHGSIKVDTISLKSNFTIVGAVWSPRITISKNLTIAGENSDIRIMVAKSTTILSVKDSHLVVRGFHFLPIDKGLGSFERLESSAPSWFDLQDGASVHFKDMVWEMGSNFALKNRPTRIDPLHPDYLADVLKTDNAVVFREVVMPPCTYTNVHFQHESTKRRPLPKWTRPHRFIAANPPQFKNALKSLRDNSDRDVEITMTANMAMNTGQIFRSIGPGVNLTKTLVFKQKGESVLWLTQSKNEEQLMDLSVTGRVHHQNIAVALKHRGNRDRRSEESDMCDWFPTFARFPDVKLGPRCLVSFRDSFLFVKDCSVFSDLSKAVLRNDTNVVFSVQQNQVTVKRMISKGYCMDNVIISCQEARLKEFLHKREQRPVQKPRLFRVTSTNVNDRHPDATDGGKTMYAMVVVFGVLLLVSVVAMLAHWGGFGMPKSINRRVNTVWKRGRKLSGKERKVPQMIGGGGGVGRPETDGFVIVSVSSDGTGVYNTGDYIYDSRCLGSQPLASQPPMGEFEAEKIDDCSELQRGLAETAVWAQPVGLGRLNEEEVVEIEQFIGRGGYGVVYKGVWKGEPVAVKTLVFEETRSSSCPRKQRAILEAGIGSIVCHANIVQTYTYTFEPSDFGPLVEKSNTRVCKMHMIQEYCEKGPLRTAMEQNSFVCSLAKQPNLRCMFDVAQDVARGMSYLHKRNIIHGDLSSKNILLRECKSDERHTPVIAKICDFGLSVKLQTAQSQLENWKAGTPLYMAPEVAKFGILSKRADVYSFGVVLWELYRSALNTWGIDRGQGIMDLPIECPLPLALLICLCLSPRPSDRPSFQDIEQILEWMMTQVDTPQFGQARRAKRSNRKFASKKIAASPQHLREFLLRGATDDQLLMGGLDVPVANTASSSDRHHFVYCLMVDVVKLGGSQMLSLAWRASSPSTLSMVSVPPTQKSAELKNEGGDTRGREPIEGGASASPRGRSADFGKKSTSVGLDRGSLSRQISSDVDATVAWVDWLVGLDSDPGWVKGQRGGPSVGYVGNQNNSGETPLRHFDRRRAASMSPTLEKQLFSAEI
ncbi:hypothetical protein BSKO_11437 [Bryopsis sp. KO-2023]|nr:hypothetical protein BSKO_11437 [Bryopsis sp. KO-2023]